MTLTSTMATAIQNNPPVSPRGDLPSLKMAGKPGVTMPATARSAGRPVDIADIRSAAVDVNLKDEVLSMFFPKHGPRKLPTLLLYDEKGLQLFEQVST